MAAYPNKKKSEYLRKHQSQAFEGAENPYSEAEDILVLIMGPTGVGKSTFVNQLIKGRGNSKEFQVGHDLDVCTHDMQSIRLPSNPEMDFPGHSKRDGFFIAVDTPGLGDTYENAADVLTRIAKWLALSYSRNVVLGCILYLHDVTESRKRREHQDYLKVFRELCGEHIWRAVTVVTTKWELVKENREEQATRRDTNLNSIFPEVARCRFEDSPQSAWDIVRASITVNNPTRGLQIQEELVEWDKIVPDTNAAKELRSILPAILGNARRWRLGDETERKQRVKKLVRQIDQLKVPLLYRFRQFIRGGAGH